MFGLIDSISRLFKLCSKQYKLCALAKCKLHTVGLHVHIQKYLIIIGLEQANL